MTALVVTLIVYKVVLLGIGAWASRRNRDGEDFYLAGRGLGPAVAAISAAASSSSVWTLLGVSGAAFTMGLGAAWARPGCSRPASAASRSTGCSSRAGCGGPRAPAGQSH